ncbi:uncharacterized protein LOC118235876 isoform X2 [Anguilla anguilla]|uniref:uncharacterized protein LOC118235876 isoform X2 n=1 Tax=Anguilla anguilla TaxID=7936 RepID=UPI0015A9DFF0|nr:uncharacterized protein LOC118235876 isoform X2 [Anguilla anguilla]XP_035289656.1 uncharacterized protein LOC118235876 isoform X2 [Anguilla anguilla]
MLWRCSAPVTVILLHTTTSGTISLALCCQRNESKNCTTCPDTLKLSTVQPSTQKKNSTPAKISVEYAPEIKEGPACSVRAAGVACLCVVDSEPPPEITWLLQRGSDASAGTERHGSITLGTLRSTQRLTELTCQASNSQGNTSAVFTPPQSGELQYISLIVAAVLLVAGMAVVVWLARRTRHNREQPVTGMDDAATTMTGTSYAMAARKEEKSINSGFYVNDEQMYGNIGVGEEDDVYTCGRCL